MDDGDSYDSPSVKIPTTTQDLYAELGAQIFTLSGGQTSPMYVHDLIDEACRINPDNFEALCAQLWCKKHRINIWIITATLWFAVKPSYALVAKLAMFIITWLLWRIYSPYFMEVVTFGARQKDKDARVAFFRLMTRVAKDTLRRLA